MTTSLHAFINALTDAQKDVSPYLHESTHPDAAFIVHFHCDEDIEAKFTKEAHSAHTQLAQNSAVLRFVETTQKAWNAYLEQTPFLKSGYTLAFCIPKNDAPRLHPYLEHEADYQGRPLGWEKHHAWWSMERFTRLQPGKSKFKVKSTTVYAPDADTALKAYLLLRTPSFADKENVLELARTTVTYYPTEDFEQDIRELYA